ncbi:MAG: hypothetical protein WCV67_09265 [Victivallaceae bacterium]|jgi:hypothetical protein
MTKSSAILMISIITAMTAFADVPPIPRLERGSAACSTVNGTSYRCLLLSGNMAPSFEIKAGNKWIPAISNSKMIVWGDSWSRLFESNLTSVKPLMEEKPDGLYVSFTESNNVAECKTLYVFKPESADLSYTLKLKKDIVKVRRATAEINPEWTLAAGSTLSCTRQDGSIKSIKIPGASTANGKYEMLLSGTVASAGIGDIRNLAGAGIVISGPFDASFEHTGSLLRWHAGTVCNPVRDFKAGETMTVKLTLAFIPGTAMTQNILKTDIAVDAGKPSCRISPYVFGIQMGAIGFGSRTKNLRHPYQNNFKFDGEARQYATDSGVSFFRAYLHTLYDVLGGSGSNTQQDPVCPSEGAPCDYTRADSFVEGLRDAGIELVPCAALYCPPWLSTRRPSEKYSGLWMIHRAPPKDNAKWAAIIAGLVRHWNIEKRWDIKLWMLGNEPDDHVRYWVGGTLPEFIDYFKTASMAMKAVDPSIRIAAPDLANLYAKAWPDNKLLWKDEFVKACKNDLDSFAFNCYSIDNFTGHVKDARATLAVNGVSDKSIFLGEYNITPGNYDNPGVFNFTGAAFLARSMKSIIENGVDRASFYSWDQPELGLLEYGSDGRLIPRPTYHAFRMHAALGRLKNGTVLQNSCDSDKLAILSSRHDDGRGYTVIITSDNQIFDKVQAVLKFKDAPGEFTVKEYRLIPDAKLAELPLKSVQSLEKPMPLELPPRSITLMVFRAK